MKNSTSTEGVEIKSSPRFFKVSTLFWAILIFGVLLRFLSWPAVFGGPEPLFLGPDCYNHFKRACLAYDNNFQIPLFNSYAGFPEGTYWIWPPFFDHCAVILAYLFKWTGFGAHLSPIWWGSLVLPIVFSLFSLLAGYLFYSLEESSELSLLSLLIFSLVPVFLGYGVLGRFDHHIAEIFFFLILLYCQLKLYETPILETKNLLLWALLLSGYGLGAFCNWSGSLIYQAFLYIIWFVFLIREKKMGSFGDLNSLLKKVSLHYGLSLLFYLLFLPPFYYIFAVSPFVAKNYRMAPMIAISLAFGTFCLLFLVIKNLEKCRNYQGRILIFAVLSPLFLIFLTPMGEMGSLLFQKYQFINKSSYITSMVREGEPLLIIDEKFTFQRAEWFFGFLFPCFFVGFAQFIWKNRGSYSSPRFLMIFLATLFTLGLTLLMNRFSLYFSPFFALFLGNFFLSLESFIHLSTFKFKKIFLFFLAALLMTSFSSFSGFFNPVVFDGDYLSVARYLREFTPPTSGMNLDPTQPEYGVLNFWFLGNPISVVGERPVLSDAHQVKAIETTEIFYTGDQGKVSDFLTKNRVKYIVFSHMDPKTARFGRLVGGYGGKEPTFLEHGLQFGGSSIPLPGDKFTQSLNFIRFLFRSKKLEHSALYEVVSPGYIRLIGKPNEKGRFFIEWLQMGEIYRWCSQFSCDEKGVAHLSYPPPLAMGDFTLGFELVNQSDLKVEKGIIRIQKGEFLPQLEVASFTLLPYPGGRGDFGEFY